MQSILLRVENRDRVIGSEDVGLGLDHCSCLLPVVWWLSCFIPRTQQCKEGKGGTRTSLNHPEPKHVFGRRKGRKKEFPGVIPLL